MDSTKQVGTIATVGGTSDASSVPEDEIILPKNASDWLAGAIRTARKTAGGTIFLPAQATTRDIGLFLKIASKNGITICREGGQKMIHCVEEGGKLFGLVGSSRKVLLPDEAFGIATVL